MTIIYRLRQEIEIITMNVYLQKRHVRSWHTGWCFIIHPCDPTVVICYLIWPCDIDVRITYLTGFPSWCPESTRPTDSCFQSTSCENFMMYSGLYQHTRVVLYIYQLLCCLALSLCCLALSCKKCKK